MRELLKLTIQLPTPSNILSLYPSDLKMQSSAGIQIVKYKALVLRHSFPMANTNNLVVGDLKPELRYLEVTWV